MWSVTMSYSVSMCVKVAQSVSKITPKIIYLLSSILKLLNLLGYFFLFLI